MNETSSSAFDVSWMDDGAVFTIDRAGKLNALTKAVLDGLAACIDRMERDGLRFLVVTGRGQKAFCAGTDLAELSGMSIEAQLSKSEMARALLVRLSRASFISVAAVNGLALGGGLELAMACSLRIASAHATFGLPEVRLGLIPAYAGTQFLPPLVGRTRAEELMLTGRTIGCDEASDIGLVHRVVESDADILGSALAFAREVTCHSAPAIAAIRACVDAADSHVTDAGLAVEDSYVRSVFSSPEAAAGVAAFLNRRPRK